jgi:hypothetical protein
MQNTSHFNPSPKTMYKLTQPVYLEKLNEAIKIEEDNTESLYSQPIYNLDKTMIALPMVETTLLILKKYCNFITDERLSTDIVEKIPESRNRLAGFPIRINIDNKGQLEHILNDTDL